MATFGSTPLNLYPGTTPGLDFGGGTSYSIGTPTSSKPKQISSIYGASGTGQVTAPYLDIAAINAQARKAAQKAVNPYYTKQLNEFLAQQGVLKKQHKTQYQTDVQNMADTLANTREANALTRGRTTEDVARNIGDINTQAGEFQTDTGQQFEDQRLAQARQQAVSGTLGTGAGANETFRATTGRNIQEQQQEQQFQQARSQQELFKGRTMQDLLRSDDLAKTSYTKGKKQAKFDLDNYIQGLKYQTKQTKNQLEKERLQTIAAEAQNQAKLGFTNYLSTITNPAQLAAAVNTYGGAF